MNITDSQTAALRRIADGSCDANRAAPSSAFRRGRDDARSRLGDVLDAGTGDAFEDAAIEMDAEAAYHEDGDQHGQGWLSALDDIRRVLPSWPWLPDSPDPAPEGSGA